jgi:hypothetical protein
MHGFSPADVDAVCEEARLLSFARIALTTAPPTAPGIAPGIAAEAASCAAAVGGGGGGGGGGSGGGASGGGGRRATCEPTEAEWWEAVRSVQPSGLLGLIEAPADADAAPPPSPPPPPPLGSLGPPAGVDDGGAGGDGWGAVGGLEGVKRRLRLLLQAPLAAAPLCAQHDQSGSTSTRITTATDGSVAPPPPPWSLWGAAAHGPPPPPGLPSGACPPLPVVTSPPLATQVRAARAGCGAARCTALRTTRHGQDAAGACARGRGRAEPARRRHPAARQARGGSLRARARVAL